MSEFIERAKFACALGGAISTLTALPKVVPIVHAAGGCAGYLSNTYSMAAGYKGSGFCGGSMLPTSNIAEQNIVFGGEDRLAEQIEHTIFALDGDLYVVITGCQVEIIGDDSISVARRYRDRNVIGASTPGFLGNALRGYDSVLSSIVEDVVEPAGTRDPLTVNIFGAVPGQDVFYRGNLDEIKRLLGLIGIRANTFFATGENVASIKSYGAAALNLVLSPAAGIAPAERFQEVHGTPWLQTELPIGPSGSAVFLRQAGEALGVDRITVEKAIRAEDAAYYSFFERIVDIYSDLDLQRYAIVVADSYYAHPLTRFLANDLGWIPYLTAINDIEEADAQAAYTERFRDISSETKPLIVYERNAGRLLEIVRNSRPRNDNRKYYDALEPAYVVGSVIERGLAEKLGAGFLSVAFPVSNRVVLNRGYAGWTGGLALVEDLLTGIVASR
ncbi:MAG: hypothetical protein LBL26_01550 [Peptococcaceae bacterium]|jgi:nitrogenase molybdenum-iron protein beta chain|nr:hypothetical protein [Peptococcaceae bacterium]